MAQPSKRWVEMVEKEQWGNEMDGFFLRPEHVVKLLSRQHNAFVRLVKKLKRQYRGEAYFVYVEALNDLLTTLQQGGKK